VATGPRKPAAQAAQDERQIALPLDPIGATQDQGGGPDAEATRERPSLSGSDIVPAVEPAPGHVALPTEVPSDLGPSRHPDTPQPEILETMDGSISTQVADRPQPTPPDEDKPCSPPGGLQCDARNTGDVAGTQFDVPIPQLIEIHELLKPLVEGPTRPQRTPRTQRPRRTRGAGASN